MLQALPSDEVIRSTRGVQHGDPLGPFLYAAGIQAALESLPPGRTMHRLYLDDGLFMGSVVEVEGVLAALQRALPTLGPELKMQKPTVWSPGLVPAASPLVAATHLHLEQVTEVLGVPIQSAVYASALEAHLDKLGAKFAHTFSAGGSFPDTQSAHALMRAARLPGPMGIIVSPLCASTRV